MAESMTQPDHEPRPSAELGPHLAASFFEESREQLCIADVDGHVIVRVNDAFASVLGYSANALVRTCLLDLVHPDHRDVTHRRLERLARGAQRVVIEHRVRDGRGQYCSVVWSASMRGQSLFVAARSVQDEGATDEEELARERRETAEVRLRSALRACDIGTYCWDVRSDAFEFDEGVERLFGFAAGEGTSLDAYIARIHVDDRVAWLETLEQCALEGRDFEREYRVVDPRGRVRWLLDKGTWLKEDGIASFLTGAVVDLTDQKRFERALQQADRRKDEFLAMLGHELRNPLAPLRTALDLIRITNGGKLDGPHALMDRQVRMLSRLVDDLLDVSRITRGRVALRKELLDLSKVVAAAVEATSVLIASRQHDLAVVLPDRPAFVVGDAVRLEQVVTNLLTNAAKYTEPGGRIRVSVEGDAEVIEARVRDTGVGLAPEMLEEGFDLFRQDERDLARSQGGLGLGLTIVRSIVELHGGTVGVTSPGRGQGSEFFVRLPAVSGEVAGGPVEEAAAMSDSTVGAPHKVLVVDDNRDGAEMLSELLRHLGADVVMATRGEEALALTADFHPRLVFLDIGMPGMDGYEVARRLQASCRGAMTLVAMTGYGQEDDLRRSAIAGFSRHLVKPVRIEQLSEILDELDEHEDERD